MVSQVLCADLNTRKRRPQYGSISGMNGSASSSPRSSSVAWISSALLTSTQSPARRLIYSMSKAASRGWSVTTPRTSGAPVTKKVAAECQPS